MVFSPAYYIFFPLLITGLADIFIAVFVILHKKNLTNITFALWGICVGFWSISVSLMSVGINPILIPFGFKAAAWIGAFIPFLFSLLGHIFPDKGLKWPLSKLFLFSLPAWVFFFVAPTNIWIKYKYVIAGSVIIDVGPWWAFAYLMYYIVYLGIGLLYLYSNFKSSKGAKRHQFIYVFLGLFLSFMFGIFCTIFPVMLGVGKLLYYGPLGTIFFVGFTAYAITKHRLMDISVVISRTLAWALTVLFLGSIYTALLMLYRTYISAQIDLLFWAWTIIYGIIVGHNFKRIQLFLQTTADRAFIKGWYDYRKVLRKVASSLGKALTREDIIKIVYPILQDDMDISDVRVDFSEDTAIDQTFSHKGITSLQGKLYVPVISDAKLLALFTLGKKRSEDDYTADDLELFRTIAEYVAIALEYIVKPYEEVKNKFETTERKLFEAEKQLERSQRLASLGTLTAGVAHEIRNPLGIIHSTAEELTDKPWSKEELAKFKESIIGNSKRITSIITNMLNLAKTKKKKYITIDLNEMIKAALQLFTINRVKLVKQLRPRVKINGEMEELKQVMINLANNALEAMPKDGTLMIKTYEDGNKVCLDVSDTGRGIPEEDVSKIFDPFYSSRHEGAGLGLSIVYRIIKEHGGDIEVKSVPGKGTAFLIKFPKAA